MKIEAYKFGSIVIDGQTYDKDLVILPDQILTNWWRKEGHKLFLEDMTFLKNCNPKILIIGCGYFGIMKISQEVRDFCSQNGINLIAKKSSEAVETFNELEGQPDIIAGFHLTC